MADLLNYDSHEDDDRDFVCGSCFKLSAQGHECIHCKTHACFENCMATHHECKECWPNSTFKKLLDEQMDDPHNLMTKHQRLEWEDRILPGSFPSGFLFTCEKLRKAHRDKVEQSYH